MESEEAPAEEEAPPAELEEAPVEEEAPPAELEEAPVEEEAPPADAPMWDDFLAQSPTYDYVEPENETITNETIDETNETVEENVTEEEGAEELSTTDRIWREGENPDEYTWTPYSFSGFFYDLDEDVGTENLTIRLRRSGDGYDRSVDEGDLEYETTADSIQFELEIWGEYKVIGFMAQKYFGSYEGVNPLVVDEDVSLLDEEQLREVLIDDDEEYTVDSGSVLELEDGYQLQINEIDLEGNKVYLSLAKDGEVVDEKVVDPTDVMSSTYLYEIDVSGEDFPLVMLHIANVFSGAETDLITIDGTFQVSDEYVTIESGDEYGEMEIDSISGDTIKMSNDNSFTLRKDSDVEVMGDVYFEVADDEVLRFAPMVKRTGSYEIRGTVVDPTEHDEFTWTPYNFEGFYYDIDDDVGTEKMTARFTGDSIEEDDLLYSTEPQSVEFEYERFGEFDVIGFMAEKYFAGYNDNTRFTEEFSVINEEELRKVLVDEDEEYTLRSGTTFPLKEGYELQVKEVDLEGNKVYMALMKDGDEVDNKVVEPGEFEVSVDDPGEFAILSSSAYTYDVEIGSEDVPIIVAHIANVFRGKEEDLATIEGIFQLSDEPRSIEEGEVYGKMEIDKVTDTGIEMKNQDSSINLGRGKTETVMENLKFKISDSDRKLVVPIVEVTAIDLKNMTIGIPIATVGTPAEVLVTSQGEPVSGAIISVNGTDVGTTDSDGKYLYSSNVSGSLDIEARKDEYNRAMGVLIVSDIEEERILAVTSPQDVMKGESFVIKATIGLDQRPVEGADIAVDGASIGTTDNLGTVSYASNEVGSHTITASKEGYESGSRKILVVSSIVVTGIEMDETVRAGKTVKITATAENGGSVSDNATLELKVNGNPAGTTNITVGPGENGSATFEYEPLEPGLYTVEVAGIQKTLTVEEKRGYYGMIAGILLLLLVIGGGAYLYSTGKLNSVTGKLNEILGQIKNR